MKKLTYLFFVLSAAALVIFGGIMGCNSESPVASTEITGGSTSLAKNTETTLSIPINESHFVPCAAGGAGEEIFFSGLAIIKFTLIQPDNNGRYSLLFTIMWDYKGVSGQGLTTGDNYNAIAASGNSFNSIRSSVQWPVRLSIGVITFKVTGPEPGIDFTVRAQPFSVDIEADGTVTLRNHSLAPQCE